MIDFTVFSAALNKVILPAIKVQQYHKAPAWQLFGGWSAEKKSAERANVGVNRFENDKMYIDMRVGNHSGVVNIAVGEKYNNGNPKIVQGYSQIKTMVGSFQIPKALLNVKDAGAIVKPLRFYSQNLGTDLAMDANRQVYGSGNGVVATTASTESGGSTTVLLKPSLNGDIDYSRYLPEGTRIKIGSNAIVTVVTAPGENTITISGSQTWAANANIVKVTGSDTTSSELDGLATMVAASGAYQNVDPATYYQWKSYVNDTSETITAANIKQKMHPAFFKAQKIGKVDWILMNAAAFMTYGESFADKIRYQAKEVLSGGWMGLDYMAGNAKILLDYDNPDDRIHFLSSEELVFGEFQPLEFEKGTDGVLLRIAGQLDYEVTASWMGNIGTTSRAAHSLLKNKTFSFT